MLYLEALKRPIWSASEFLGKSCLVAQINTMLKADEERWDPVSYAERTIPAEHVDGDNVSLSMMSA